MTPEEKPSVTKQRAFLDAQHLFVIGASSQKIRECYVK